MYRFAVVASAILAASLSNGASAQTQAATEDVDAITWRVVDRFRLFDRGDAAARLRVEQALDALNRQSGDRAEDAIRPHYSLLLETLSGPAADSLRRSNWRWSRTTDEVGHRQYEPDYLYPSTYQIEARRSQGGAGICRWTVDGSQEQAAPCADPVRLSIRAASMNGRWRGQGDVAVVDDLGPAHSIEVEIEDRLIVAMGDSFSSGEGNPDVPSVIDPSIPAGPAFRRPDWPETAAARPYIEPATWWDEPCHRSLLSWPVLASFWLASQDEQRAVTLVHVGCSGAEEDDGVNKRQQKLPGGGNEAASQADQVRSLLAAGPGRPIDRVLLSLGGNDVGFVPVINYAVLPPNGYGLGPLDVIPALIVGGVGKAIPPYETRDAMPLWALGPWRTSAQTRMHDLPVRLERVAETFTGLGVAPNQVVHTVYPDLLRDDRGDFCRTVLSVPDLEAHPMGSDYRIRETAYRDRDRNADDERGGFESVLTELPWFVKLRTNWNFQFQYYPDEGSEGCDSDLTLPTDSEVCKAQWVRTRLNEEVRRSHSDRGWLVADAHVETSAGHGWCVSPGDSLRMPVSVQQGGAWRWSPESPAAFQPYREDLGRWFRTTNDSVRSQWASPDRMIQGTIHPTYNMHIAYAEAVADVAFADE